MKSFFDIPEWDKTIQLLRESDGEVTDEIAELMAINNSTLIDDVETQITGLRKLEADNENLDAYIKKLQTAKKANNYVIGIIEQNLLTAAKKYGSEGKIKDVSRGVSLWVKKTKEVNVTDISKVSSEYLNWTVKGKLPTGLKNELARILSNKPITFEPVVMKDEIKKAMEAKVHVGSGVELKENENIQIS